MKIISNLFSLILPKKCLCCKSRIKKDLGDIICLECWKRVKFSCGPLCPLCGRSFLSEAALSRSPDYICGLCRKKRPHFDKHIHIGPYNGVLSEVIRLFKYRKKMSLAYPLSYLLCKKINDIPEVDILIPVPLHTKKLRSREFNQSLLLSDLLSSHLCIPILKDIMIRYKDTVPQVKLDKHKRRQNVKNVFHITDNLSIKGRRVLVVDDVFTTGSTVNECAKTLKKSGAYKVYVITLAMVNT